MATELNDFLDVEAGPADAGSAGDVAPAPAGAGGAAAAPGGDGGAGGAGAADGAAAGGAGAVAPVVVPPVEPPEEIPEDIRGLRNALQAERGKRNDHKGRADRAEGELLATKAALAEAQRVAAAPPAPAPAAVAAAAPAAAADPPAVVPNPLEDPAAYHAYNQRMLFNERLNISEAMLREASGTEKIDEKLTAFKKALETNPQLRTEFSRQVHPYRWAYDQGTKLLALAEVGDDPAAFRARVKAEARAEIEAELSGAAPASGAVSAVVIPRSLASATSSAPRMQAVEPAPEFEDIFKPRKRA